ncbi:vancomycin resistance histidine kinase VanS [Clostridioides difficile]|uniref:vancomycin resistance histidine kinase VanS n=1 Tax=Clostridioides difficile TaxID=1496 RepID=UPI0003F5380C
MKNRNNKKQKMGNEFKNLQTKLFVRTVVIMLVAVVAVYALYTFVLHGNFANFVVNFINFFIDDYLQALHIYQAVFRNYMDLYILLAIAIVFLIVLKIYLRGFTKYFNEINKGIDTLIDENSGDVVLSSELVATEKKMNYIKHTIQQQKLAAELAEQRKNDLVVYLAHDLKTPLTSVIGYLTLLRDENQISEELREKYLSISLEKAERLEDLINEFFEITRFNLSSITLEYSRINLTRMLEQLVYEFKPMLLEKNLKCELDIPPNIMIKIDANKMQRVFDNLLRNAVNYSFDNGTIYIAVKQDENNLHIKFTNCGNTIPKEKLERIFEQFYRLDTARSSRSGGAGLGLAIAKEIVELHNGTITAESKDETIEFEVILPLL